MMSCENLIFGDHQMLTNIGANCGKWLDTDDTKPYVTQPIKKHFTIRYTVTQ